MNSRSCYKEACSKRPLLYEPQVFPPPNYSNLQPVSYQGTRRKVSVDARCVVGHGLVGGVGVSTSFPHQSTVQVRAQRIVVQPRTSSTVVEPSLVEVRVVAPLI